MELSSFDTATLSDNLDRIDRDLMFLAKLSGVSHDDLRVKILTGKRNVCSLIIEGANTEFIDKEISVLSSLGCRSAIDKFMENGRWS